VVDGVTEQEARAAVTARMVQREQPRASDGVVACLLQSLFAYERVTTFVIERHAACRALTVDQINTALRRN